MFLSKQLAIGAATLLLAAVGSGAQAGTWQQQHPRRAEVNARLANQNRRIHADVRNGTLSPRQAHALHQNDHAIRHEERSMARQNAGHITKTEQHELNQRENGVSRAIPRR
jgi:uncharacterized protein HemX